ncbi:MAG: type II toxin-antitoxin system HicA family toxin [Magnetospirillum sp.]|nr:type II toxin-antitoxin system HicA family toxin [Magnetospirillum sp.]
MTRADRLLAAMEANPAADWRIVDIEAICRHYGLMITAPRGGGSHFKVRRTGARAILTIPARRPILAVYIRALVSLIKDVPP